MRRDTRMDYIADIRWLDKIKKFKDDFKDDEIRY